MESVNYLRGLLRSWWLILLVVIAGGAGGYAVYSQATPQYAASVRIIVATDNPQGDEAAARTLTALRAGTISGVASIGPVLDVAAQSAGRSQDLAGVSVDATSAESFITVVVSGPSPAVVRDIAASYPDILTKQTDKFAGATGTPFSLNVVSAPTLPTEPFEPSLKKNIGLGLGAGLILGLALAVLRETLNRTVRDSEELRQITGLTVLGIVPRDLPKQLLPASSHPRSARAEAYRQVRTTLMSASERRPMVVAVTSATQGEGKTSVASNLAVVLSRSGHRVALVDADLRRPRVADFFDIKSKVGLTDVLTGEVPLINALELRDDDRFAILPAGSIPTNPSEALGSPGMRDVLRALSGAFEFVIIDTPPVLPVTDALVLAPYVDGIVLVARLGYTTRERVERAMAGVERVNATVFGVVPNQSGKGSDSDYSYTYRSTPTKRGDTETVVPEDRLRLVDGPSPSSVGRHRGEKPTVPVAGTDDTTTGSRAAGSGSTERH